MFSVLLFAVNAVVPILLLLALGYALTKKGMLSHEFLNRGNTLVFKLLLPMTIFHNIYEVESIAFINWSLVLFCLVTVLLICAIGFVCSLFLVKERDAKGVFIQCTFRSNFAIIGLPLAQSLGGAPAAAVAAILSAFIVPLFNVLAVILLTVYAGESKGHSGKKIVSDIVKNPLIIAACVGLLALVIRNFIPLDDAGNLVFTLKNDMSFLYKAVEWLHLASSPLALIVMGGLLDFSAIRGKLTNIVSGTLFRLVASPVIGLSLALILEQLNVMNITAGEYGSLIALFGSPVAVSSAIMVSNIGGDDELARQYVVWTSVGSMITLFLITAVMRGTGII